jgi:vacuolar-type H+-ATPase subunit H
VNDDVSDLIRELAVEHGVALDRSDPILVLQTATRRILEGVLRQAEQAQSEALKQHRSELEAAAAKWHEDSKRTASQFLQHVPASIASGVSAELHKAASAAVRELDHALERHNKALSRATFTCALSAAVAVLAAATFVWASLGAPDRPAARTEDVACTAGTVPCR